jgi:predicted Zn-dependent protease
MEISVRPMQAHHTISVRVLAAVLALTLLLPLVSPHSVGAITVKEEEDLSKKVLQSIFKHFEVIEDPYIWRYVNAVGQRILSKMPDQPFRYQFYVIKEPTYNAFAIPAGHIFINSGLFAAMETEEELAGILGHEISHVFCRHISERIERSKKTGMASLAGIAAGILLGAAGAGEAASAVTMGSAAAGISAELAYSRDNEMQADQIGLKVLTEAGYSPSGLLEVLRKIRSKTVFDTEQFPTYLRTHPAVDDRLAYIDSWIATEQAAGKLPPPVDPAEFNHIVTRLRVEYGDENQVLDNYSANLRKHPDDPMANYHYGLILTRLDRRGEAIRHLKKALAKRAFDPYILRDLAKVYFLDGQFEQAQKLLQGVESSRPEDPDTLFYSGRTYLELGQLSEATGQFKKLIEKEPIYRQAHYFLGKSLSEQGKPGEAAYHLGIFYLRGREYRNAVMQFKRALEHTEDAEQRREIEKMLTIARQNLEGAKPKKG